VDFELTLPEATLIFASDSHLEILSSSGFEKPNSKIPYKFY
jgi:hypothetical protein